MFKINHSVVIVIIPWAEKNLWIYRVSQEKEKEEEQEEEEKEEGVKERRK